MEFYLSNKYIGVLIFSFLVLVGCKNEEKPTQETVKKQVEYKMYQPSEMAGFMNAMYAYNLQL